MGVATSLLFMMFLRSLSWRKFRNFIAVGILTLGFVASPSFTR